MATLYGQVDIALTGVTSECLRQAAVRSGGGGQRHVTPLTRNVNACYKQPPSVQHVKTASDFLSTLCRCIPLLLSVTPTSVQPYHP